MDHRHTCNLCFRRFASGRALGGHMRSHVVSAAPPSRTRLQGYSSDSSSSGQAAVELAVEEEEVGLSYGLRTNPRKSFRLVDPEFSSSIAAVEPAGSCVVVQDRESETESPRAHCPRTKRPRSVAATPPPEQPEAEPVSSVSDATLEEDVALCLMMLSRDSWAAAEEAHRPSYGSDDEDERRVAARARPPPPRKGRSRYQCGACKKVFRSYQALGGHRASHKRTNCCSPAAGPRTSGEADFVDAKADTKVHECPFCFRVFSSGQALGGHKRSHFTSSATTVNDNSPPSTSPDPTPTKYGSSSNLIDLNLPAQAEDDIERSAISDMDFVANPTSSGIQ